MTNPPIKTCRMDTCDQCGISEKTNCRFEFKQLWRFYLIALPAFVIAGIFLFYFHPEAFYRWVMILALFFLVVEIRVLCSHCPHYEKSSFFLRCWANYGAPKLWRYRPGPLNLIEKVSLIAGFVIVWGWPAYFLLVQRTWTVAVLYGLSVVLFFTVLKTKYCTRCINLSCPLNRVDPETKKAFLENNPDILKHWKAKK